MGGLSRRGPGPVVAFPGDLEMEKRPHGLDPLGARGGGAVAEPPAEGDPGSGDGAGPTVAS